MKRKIVSIIIIVIVLLLNGCKDKMEIEQRGIVSGAALDISKDKSVNMSTQIIKPPKSKEAGQQSGTENGPFVINLEADSALSSARNMNLFSDRQIYFASAETFIISESMARNGISFLLDAFNMHQRIRRTILMLVSPGEARDILETEDEYGQTSSSAISNMLNLNISHTSGSIKISANDFIRDMECEGIQPIMSGVTIKEQTAKGKVKKYPQLSGIAVFKDGKMVGWLDERETRGMLWLRKKIRTGTWEVKTKNSNFTFGLLKHKIDIQPNYYKSRFNIKISVNADAFLGEERGKLFTMTPQIKRQLETALEQCINDEISSAIIKCMAYKSDAMGFGNAFFRRYPRLWPQWEAKWDDEIFPSISFSINVKANITNTELALSPVKSK